MATGGVPEAIFHHEEVAEWLKARGIRGLVGKNDWPRFTEQEPEIYEKEELAKLFRVCNGEEKLWFEFSSWPGFVSKRLCTSLGMT